MGVHTYGISFNGVGNLPDAGNGLALLEELDHFRKGDWVCWFWL